MSDTTDDIDWYDPDDYDDEPDELVELEILEMKAETEKAYLVVTKDFQEWWLPKSLCTCNKESKSIDVPEWLRDKKLEEENDK